MPIEVLALAEGAREENTSRSKLKKVENSLKGSLMKKVLISIKEVKIIIQKVL